ncbi:sigma-70 family RNA polymerase sigma factor [Nannocystis sp. bb15-2]|uniref:Sigma-70 family RNA polymerase sigma factor n=1 Tax=Nannocystis bainbridge TaxID=2995303 RepID=A0ABT5EF88_9BACT|nr:sigma-70 family RNA polymerase sigma factor [Nannocystis bainbridge]
MGSDIEPAPAVTAGAAALLELARAGDPRTGEVLFDLVGAQVNRLVWRVLGADEDHDDLVQEVFVALLAGLTRVREADALRGWVAAVTINTVRSEIRRRRVRRWFGMQAAPDDLGHTPTASHEARELLGRTYAVLGRLPADERIAFALRFIDEQPLGDVAAACSCSLATVKRRISAAQARFRRLAERDPMLAEHLRELEVQR